jgi:hypothetical protein
MNLSFLQYFKKNRTPAGAIALAPQPSPAIEKSASERFGKTVMPNSSRIVGLEPSRNFPVLAPVSSPTPAGPRKISLGGSGAVAVAPITPGGERTIALQLIDLAPHIPGEMLKPAPIDPQLRVILPASEIECGMATGRPTVLLRAIYQQAPDCFTCEVDAANQTEVALPVGKVLEQFGSFQVRDDQICDQAIPQVETPFLKVTLEDSERFGTPVAPLQTSNQPPSAVQPAVADTIATAPPGVVTEIKPPTPVRKPVPKETNGNAGGSPAKAPIRLDQPPATLPIKAKISPNGTGVPAIERVPASSGPPVPTHLPAPLAPSAPAAPARIPFKVSPPSNDLRPPILRAARSEAESIEFSTSGPRIQLPLRSILRGISPVQLSGSIEEVPEAAVIELPFAIIEPQLSLGRVAISPAQFQAAMPEEYRRLFKAEEAGLPVALSLQEVLQNLPNESLQIRGDQEEVEIGEAFETPFSQKMAEDAARMKMLGGPTAKAATTFAEPEPMPKSVLPAAKEVSVIAADPIAKPAVKIALYGKSDVVAGTKPGSPTAATGSEPTSTSEPAAAGLAGRTALQVALDTDETLTAKSVIVHANRLPGVIACAIVFSDGLSLAGNIPAEYEAEALCALAPSIVRRISDQMMGTNLGALSGLTLFCAKAPVSFFAHGNICLAAIHSAGELAAEIRDRLGCIAQELARMYANQPND